MKTFLETFFFPEGLLAVAIGNPSNTSFHATPPETPVDRDVFFGPAMRQTKGNEKKDVLGTTVLWVDVDSPIKPQTTFPPTFIVSSGHGWHLYWHLTEPITQHEIIEHLNKLLAEDAPGGDVSCFNVNRVLRVPGSVNTKDPPARVTLDTSRPIRYTRDDMMILERLNKKTRHKIRTGDSRGYRSRSERDWAIIIALIEAGASDSLIDTIFAFQPCGDKARDATDKYLERTLLKARESHGPTVATAPVSHAKTMTEDEEFEETPEGYFVKQRRGRARVSTFTIAPTLLLDGSKFGAEDAIVSNVLAGGYEWKDVTFTRSAFTTVRKMDDQTPVAAWQWLGTDAHLRSLLPFLLERLKEQGLPRVVATPTLGLHWVHDKPYYLGDQQVLSAQELWQGFEGPIAWLPSQKEHPKMVLSTDITEQELDIVRDSVPDLNEPEAIWPAIGWYAAACLKPWLETKGYRFPTLSVVGTKGSGKTTLIQRILMPLFGQKEAKSYDAGTTRFVILALLGSSNAIPIAFSEFRYEAVESFLRYVLLAYDTGHDPRGRPDQTTVDYPLSAPFSLDGEDLIADPAARERIVVVHLNPDAIAEGSVAYDTFNRFRWTVPQCFGSYYIQHALGWMLDGTLDDILAKSREDLFDRIPQRMPDRIRNNHIVSLFGARVFAKSLGLPDIEPSVLLRSINTIYNVTAGRARTMVDDMVEDIVNACSQSSHSFRWSYEDASKTLWFQLSSAHTWWLTSRRRQGRGALERDALRSQLLEAPYTTKPIVMDGAYMFGIILPGALDAGLDVPSYLKVREISVRF